MAKSPLGSLTKEPPLATIDATINAIKPGMSYGELLDFARNNSNTHKDAPGLARNRFLLIDSNETIEYDYFISLVKSFGIQSPIVRKTMYFLWAYRDHRIREFICERVAGKNGLWRVAQLENKSNASFFTKWLAEGTSVKARSNFEYFLVETGIFNSKKKTIDLNIDDGWLAHAATAAAQHEKDPSARDSLVSDPIEFLKSRGWMGLINLEVDTSVKITATEFAVAGPGEDAELLTNDRISTSAEWNRSAPTFSKKGKATAEIDLVSRERASTSHFLLEKLLAEIARQNNCIPKSNQNIDMHFTTSDGPILVEIKSCTDRNFHSQVRKGISQLFEYRFVHSKLFNSEPVMLLVMENKPPKRKEWLAEYVNSLGIIIAWKEFDSSRLVSSSKIPDALTKFVLAAKN